MITSNVIKYEYGKSRKGDSETLVADVSKLKKYIDWTPSYNNLNIIIKTAIAWETQLNEKNL